MSQTRPFLCLLAALLIGLPGALAVPAAAQTRVENVAVLHFRVAGGDLRTVESNRVALDIADREPSRRQAVIRVRQLPAGYVMAVRGGSCQAGHMAELTSAAVSESEERNAREIGSLDPFSSAMIVLENAGGNHDRGGVETADLRVRSDHAELLLHLHETGADTGMFAGVLPAMTDDRRSLDDPCDLQLERTRDLRLTFAGDDDSADTERVLPIDRIGQVFDSRTGAPIEGATVTIVDEATGQSAMIADGRDREDIMRGGRFRIPVMNAGAYRLVVTAPRGYSAPSKLPPDELAGYAVADGPVVLSDASYGRPFTLAAPASLRVDIPLDPQDAAPLTLEKTASVRVASPGDVIEYRLRLTNRGVRTMTGTVITDTLPPGLRYRRGTTSGAARPDVASDGRTLSFLVPAMAAGEIISLRYLVEVMPGAPPGEAVSHALAISDADASNRASAAVRLRPLLFTDASTIIGRVTEGACGDQAPVREGVPGIRLMMEDGALASTDPDGLYHFEGVRPGTHVVQLDANAIVGRYEAVACDDDTRQAGNALSRFVEAGGGSLHRVDFQLRRVVDAPAIIAPDDPGPTAIPNAEAAGGTRNWAAGQRPGIAWLFPAVDHNPRAPALRVVIKHHPGQHIALTINRRAVEPLSFDGVDTDPASGVAVSTWTGIPLAARDNDLVATVREGDGAVAAVLTRTVHYAIAPALATYLPERSRPIADGIHRPQLAIRVTDRDGKPVRAGTLVSFTVDPPHAAAIAEADLLSSRAPSGQHRAAALARVVGDDGIAILSLRPTMMGGTVGVTVQIDDDEGASRAIPLRPWLAAPATQDWTLVGFGKGTIGFETLRDRSHRLAGRDRGKAVTEGELKFYAKGRIKGSWLATVAYDSTRRPDRDRGLFGAIDPNRYYTVYGDGSRQGYDAPTDGKLYVRLENRSFRAMFGDFETGLTDADLTRYSRTLNGLKLDYAGRHILFSGFAAQNSQLYARDEIQGSGLSGPYRLSGRGIVPNSDKLRIEVRDRFRPEIIVSSRDLARHIDYDIDTDAATVTFGDPVPSRDAALNPVFIVAEYETAQGRSVNRVAGGRAAFRMAGGRAELGASMLYDESGRAGTVAGLDAKARLSSNTQVRAEVAAGGRDGIGHGRAFTAEIVHRRAGWDASAYLRQQDVAFGLGQQNGVEAGTRKVGMDGRLMLSPRLSLSGSAWHQTDIDNAGRRTAGQAQLEYRTLTGTVFAGGEFASDIGRSGAPRDSRLLTLGGSQRPFGQRLELFGQTQLALGSAASTDFPVRHRVGAAYEIRPGFRLIAAHEIANGGVQTARQTHIGVDVAPWTGAKVAATLGQEAIGEGGSRDFARYSLSQNVPIGRHWTIDATFDAASTLRGGPAVQGSINPLHPSASSGGLDQDGGNGDHHAVTLGAAYRDGGWSWSGRLDYRRGSASDRLGATSSALRALGDGRTLAAGLRAYAVTQRSGAAASFASADLALALRPPASHWSLLERLELRRDRSDAGVRTATVDGYAADILGRGTTGGEQRSTRIVANAAANYRTGREGDTHGWEASLYHGIKYVAGRFGDEHYTGLIDVIGFELRRDLGRHLDIGINAARQHSWTSDVSHYSIGPSIGFSPVKNIWFSTGYNLTGFRDRDFEDARTTRQGAYLTMRLKFDQLSLARAGQRLPSVLQEYRP